MSSRMIRALPPALILSLTGCAVNDARFPSLLPRANETRSEGEPERPMPVVTPDPVLEKNLQLISQSVEQSAVSFAALLAEATTLTSKAKGAAMGSDPWLAAQAKLADLDVVRAQSSSALSDIDRLAADRAAAGLPPYPAIAAARTMIEERLSQLNQQISLLETQLR